MAPRKQVLRWASTASARYLLIIVCACLSCPLFAERVVTRRPLASSSAELRNVRLGQATEIFVRSPEGKLRLRLRRIEFRGLEGEFSAHSQTEVRLFKGASLDRMSQRKRWVAADIIGAELRVWFLGPRRSRLYQLEERAPGKPLRLRHLPSRYSIGCAGTALPPRSPSQSATSTASPKRIQIAFEYDYEFWRRYGSKAAAEILSRVNLADQIYSTQLDLRLIPRAAHGFRTSSQPFTSQSASVLLAQFQEYSTEKRQLGRADLYHLFSGKALSFGVIGLAYLTQICLDGGNFSFGLSASSNELVAPLVLAHEIGHNLGAQHPEDLLGPSNEPSLMTSFLQAGYSTFSEFSKGEIVQTLQAQGGCVK